MLNREPIFAALFARLAAAPGFRSYSRRLVLPVDVPAARQPALFLTQTGQEPSHVTGRTTLWTLGSAIYIYSRDEDGPTGASPAVNNALDRIEQAFAFDNLQDNACTLGGLVQWARMGAVEITEGLDMGQSVVRIAVEMSAVS